MNLLSMPSAEVERRILEAFINTREKNGLIEWTHEIFRISGSTIMFTATLTYSTGQQQRFLVKGALHGLDVGNEIGDLLTSTLNAELHNLPVGEPIVCSYKNVTTESGAEERVPVSTALTAVYPGTISLQPQLFFPDTVTLHEYFMGLRKKTKLTEDDDRVINLLSSRFQDLHASRKIPLALRDHTHQCIDDYTREECNQIYNRRLNEVPTQFQHYMTAPSTHPVLTKRRRRELRELLDDMVDTWNDRGDRLSIIIGDSHDLNILLQMVKGLCNRVRCVDAHRRMFLFDAAYDLGRLLFDGVQWELVTGNPIYLDWNDRLLDVHAERTGDKELGKVSTVGMVSRLAWAICPNNNRNKIRAENAPDPNPSFDPEYAIALYSTIIPFVLEGKTRFSR